MNEKVVICEMSPRDGMQVLNRSARVPLEMRVELVRTLQRAGFPYIEAGSFVSSAAFPQFADMQELLQRVAQPAGGAQLAVLVPNLKYYEKLKDAPNVTTVAMFLSASEEYSRQNKRMTIEEDLAESKRLAAAARARGQRLRAHLSAAFRNLPPHEGPSDVELVTRMCNELLDMGCEIVALADTDGRATPLNMQRTLAHLTSRIDVSRLGVHLHDQFGQAIANAWEAYRHGIRTFDSAIGGIGGNKAVEKSFGNIATEQLVGLFDLLGVETGIDRDAIREAARIIYRMTQLVGDPPPASRMMEEILLSEASPGGTSV